jgi:ribose 5-phosphate isomerase B
MTLIAHNIAIGCDHAGPALKSKVTALLTELGANVINLGTDGDESVDYPDFGQAVAQAVIDGKAEMGVLICGSGIGISIAANRFADIRCALCHDANTATLSRLHNNANVIALGARIVDEATALDSIKAFFTTEFEGGRHQKRIDKMC